MPDAVFEEPGAGWPMTDARPTFALERLSLLPDGRVA